MKWKLPIILALLGMVGGVFISILFGINEKIFKDKIADQLKSNEKIQMIADPVIKAKKIAKEKSKNWRYYQRFHFHSSAIGAMSLSIILFLFAFSRAPERFRLVAAHLIGIGGFLYPFVWLGAAIYGPELGRSVAKEKFAVLGYMGGLFLVGALLSLFLVAQYPLKDSKDS